jgi:hypothetical protein
MTMVGYGSFPPFGYLIYLVAGLGYLSLVYGLAKGEYPEATLAKTFGFLITGQRDHGWSNP